jgi:hypothetical protein
VNGDKGRVAFRMMPSAILVASLIVAEIKHQIENPAVTNGMSVSISILNSKKTDNAKRDDHD